MTPPSDVDTIRCLLCRGVVCFSPEDDSRYKDHLNVEHRVYYYLSWIIEKTVEENSREGELDSAALTLPSITITPVTKTSNGSVMPSIVSVKSEAVEDDEDESSPPSLSVFPLQQQMMMMEEAEEIEIDGAEDGMHNGFLQTTAAAVEEEEEEEIGIKEAKIITIRVEGQRVGGRKMYKCSLCPNIKPWPTIHKAERHRITHIPLAFRKMFQCPECKERFIKEKNVKRHLDSGLCQGPKDHPCTVCGEIYESKFDLQLHEETHEQLLKRHRCHLCGAKFNKMKYLNKHILSHSNRKPYKCDICGKSFKSEYYVKTHRNAHLNDNGGGGRRGAELNGNPAVDDLDFQDHLTPEIDLIEEDPITQETE